jgi:hypothetical protein
MLLGGHLEDAWGHLSLHAQAFYASMPPRRDRPVHFSIPALNSAEDASKVMGAITTAVACGELTPAEAAELSRVIEAYVKAIEMSEIERRLKILEKRQLTG